VLTELGTNSFFGEMALLNRGGVAVASVRVKGFCETYHLSVGAYAQLVNDFPDFRNYVEAVARLRLGNLLKSDCSALSAADVVAHHKDEAPNRGIQENNLSLGELFDTLNPAVRQMMSNSKRAKRASVEGGSPTKGNKWRIGMNKMRDAVSKSPEAKPTGAKSASAHGSPGHVATRQVAPPPACKLPSSTLSC